MNMVNLQMLDKIYRILHILAADSVDHSLSPGQKLVIWATGQESAIDPLTNREDDILHFHGMGTNRGHLMMEFSASSEAQKTSAASRSTFIKISVPILLYFCCILFELLTR